MKARRNIDRLRITPGERVHVNEFDPNYKGKDSKKEALVKIAKLRVRMSDLQQRLSAERKRSLLICLQGLDAAGKDGVVEHVIGSMNPNGCRVANFKGR